MITLFDNLVMHDCSPYNVCRQVTIPLTLLMLMEKENSKNVSKMKYDTTDICTNVNSKEYCKTYINSIDNGNMTMMMKV